MIQNHYGDISFNLLPALCAANKRHVTSFKFQYIQDMEDIGHVVPNVK